MNKTAAAINMMTGCLILSCTGRPDNQQKHLQKSGILPNVIFILADDLGIGDLGCYGQTKFSTPNIDRLADEGIKFTSHYTGGPVSAPSRCSLLTGLHTGHCTIRQNHSLLTGKRVSLSENDYTIAMLAREAGYRTAIFGKWGLGEPGTEGTPDKRGFDRFTGYLNNNHCEFYYTDSLYNNSDTFMISANRGGRKGVYTHDLFTSGAKDFINENRENPFFLYLAYTIPHKLYQVPEEDSDPFRGKFIDDGMVKFDSVRAVYAGMITRMDRHIGEIMQLLKDSGIDKNTLMIFTSDNGAIVSRLNEGDADYFNSNGIYRGYKGELYEGGIRTPFVARWPGKIKPGSVTDHPSAFWDFMPTLADIAGIESPSTDGISYLRAMLGKKILKQHKYLYWEYSSNGRARQAARIGNYKVIRRNGIDSEIEVYDLMEDPGETNDISGENPELVARGLNIFSEAHLENPDYPLAKK